MAFEYKRQFPKGDANNGHGRGHGNGNGSHDAVANPAANTAADTAADTADPPLDQRVLRYVPTPPAPRDFGREQADKRAETQSIKSQRLRQHLDCEPPWDILRARASFDGPVSRLEPWPDRFDIWPTDMAGYWPCPICDTKLAPVERTATKLFRCVTCDTETIVHVRAPVVDCPHHGRHEIALPWHQNDMKWTYLGTEPAGK